MKRNGLKAIPKNTRTRARKADPVSLNRKRVFHDDPFIFRGGLHHLLRRVGRAMLIAGLVEGFLDGLCVLIAMLLAAVVIDAALGLNRYGLVVMDTALLGPGGWVAWRVVLSAHRDGFNARRAAVMIERRLAVGDSRLINAVDLTEHASSGTSDSLREQAIDRGEALAQTISPGSVVDCAVLSRSFKRAGVAGLIILVAYVAVPRVFYAVLPRLLTPWADYPPFTVVRFDIQADPQPAAFGRAAWVGVTLTGPGIPDQAEVVFIDGGVKSQPLPMTRTTTLPGDAASLGVSPASDATHFSFRIDRVVSPRYFYIDTPRGRSKRHLLSVDTSPKFERLYVTYHDPANTGVPDKAEPLGIGIIRAPAGTEVTLRVVSNVPLGVGTLTIMSPTSTGGGDEQRTALIPDPDDPTVAAARFILKDPGRFELTLVGADGTHGVWPLAGDLDAPFNDDSPRQPGPAQQDSASTDRADGTHGMGAGVGTGDGGGSRSSKPGEETATKSVTGEAEVVGVGDRPYQGIAAASLSGIPAEYREQAQAYFKRLAAESR